MKYALKLLLFVVWIHIWSTPSLAQQIKKRCDQDMIEFMVIEDQKSRSEIFGLFHDAFMVHSEYMFQEFITLAYNMLQPESFWARVPFGLNENYTYGSLELVDNPWVDDWMDIEVYSYQSTPLDVGMFALDGQQILELYVKHSVVIIQYGNPKKEPKLDKEPSESLCYIDLVSSFYLDGLWQPSLGRTVTKQHGMSFLHIMGDHLPDVFKDTGYANFMIAVDPMQRRIIGLIEPSHDSFFDQPIQSVWDDQMIQRLDE